MLCEIPIERIVVGKNVSLAFMCKVHCRGNISSRAPSGKTGITEYKKNTDSFNMLFDEKQAIKYDSI